MHLNPVHAETADQYLEDLRDSVAEVRASRATAEQPVERTY
jgi:hypothetical protein